MVQNLRQYGLSLVLIRLSALLSLPFLFPSYAAAQFFQPGLGEVWRVGDVMTIEYQTTMSNYTIALWQEGPPKTQTALKGPILFRTVTGPDTGFKWKVQLYGFNLEESNVFFLWLKQGGPNNQDNMNAERLSTPYFNITNAPRPVTTSKPSTTADLSSTSTNPPSSTSSSVESPSPISTASSITSSSATPSSTAPSAANNGEPSAQGASGLPVGAQAGIGVGVSIVGLTCIVCAVLWYRHLKKKRQILADSQQNDITAYSPPSMSDPWKASELPHGYFLRPPAELRNGHSPVEIGAGGDFAEMPTPMDYPPAELGNHPVTGRSWKY